MSLFDLRSWRESHSGSVSLADSRFAVVDVETTGLFPERHDRIVEIAIVHLDQQFQITREWTSVVNPNRDLGPTHIHGITGSIAKNAPSFHDVADDLIHLLQGRVFIAHNASFDVRFVESEFDRLGLPLPPLPAIDTKELADGLPLVDACRTYSVAQHDAHTALGDAQATAKLFQAMLHSTFAWAKTLDDLGCPDSPAELGAWPALAYEPTEHHRSESAAATIHPTEITFSSGMSVCFTGEARRAFDGRPISRALATELASHAGLVVKSGISKKLDVLVAADPESLSGKARKARDYSIPVISHEQFWSGVGIETTPLSPDW
jgi:DNA polymerase-3 subunit epsilon